MNRDLISFIGPILAVVGLVTGYVYYKRAQKPKRLYYRVTADQGLMSPRANEADWDNLVVQFEDRPVKHPRITTMEITNSGKVELRKEDYDELLRVEVGKEAAIVSAYVLLQPVGDTQVTQLPPEELSQASVTAPAVLLNPGDRLEFRLLLDGDENIVRVGGRLAGFQLKPHPQKRSQDTDASAIRTGPFVVLGVAGAAAVAAATGVLTLNLQDLAQDRRHDAVSSAEALEAQVEAAQRRLNAPRSVPRLIGRTEREAQERLKEAGFVSVRVLVPPAVPRGTNYGSLPVVSSAPAAGSQLGPSEVVTLRLGPP